MINTFPYKIQVCQKLKEGVKFKRKEFSSTFLEMMQEDEKFIEKLNMSDEAHFHLNAP